MARNLRTIRLTVQYDGSNYAGWQSQKNGRTIQETIERALAKITGERIVIIGSGRTDAGVHALGQVAHFTTSSRLPADRLKRALNSILPGDIVIAAAADAPPRFHAQFDAKAKVYRYALATGDTVDPLIRNFVGRARYRLDIAAMRREARELIGRHDFKAFLRARGERGQDTRRNMRRVTITAKKDMVYFELEADGFLYNMVRTIVGTLVEVGRGKFPPGTIRTILRTKDRRRCGPTMSARGLVLVRVTYEPLR